MKPKSPLKDLTLIQIIQRFDTDEKARKHLESVLWPHGIVCPKCQCNDQSKFGEIKPNAKAKTRAGLRWCSNCKSKFTVTMGTIFEDSHIPLGKWLIAWYLLCSSKKGIAALELQRLLELGSYRTALFMAHRIRHALKNEVFAEKLTGVVEVDEVLIGGSCPQAKGGMLTNKTRVISLVQRGGHVRSKATVSGANLKEIIRENVSPKAEVNTDSLSGYKSLKGYFKEHNTVNHSKAEFSRREYGYLISTCGVEAYFSNLKRGIMGVFHHVSAQHLPLYLAEFDHRHNYRKVTDGERTDAGLQMARGKRLIYKQ